MSSSIFIRCLVSFLNFLLSIFVSVVNFVTKSQEIGNTPIWVLPNIWRLRRVSDTKFGTNVSDEMLLNAAKCQGYNFYCFWVIKGKPTGEGAGGKITLPPPLPPPPPRLGLIKLQTSDLKYYVKRDSDPGTFLWTSFFKNIFYTEHFRTTACDNVHNTKAGA